MFKQGLRNLSQLYLHGTFAALFLIRYYLNKVFAG